MNATEEDLRSQLAVLAARVEELEATQRALRESDLRFRQLAETIRQVLYITSTDHRVVHYVSPAYETSGAVPAPASTRTRCRGWRAFTPKTAAACWRG